MLRLFTATPQWKPSLSSRSRHSSSVWSSTTGRVRLSDTPSIRWNHSVGNSQTNVSRQGLKCHDRIRQRNLQQQLQLQQSTNHPGSVPRWYVLDGTRRHADCPQHHQSSSSFRRLRACYLSSASNVLQLESEDGTNSGSEQGQEHRPSQPQHHPHPESPPPMQADRPYDLKNCDDYSYRYELNRWYRLRHGLPSISDAYVTEMAVLDDSVSDADGAPNNVATLWTASFVCPIDKGVVVEAGQLPGCVNVRGRNYYLKKKVALQAAAKAALAVKIQKEGHLGGTYEFRGEGGGDGDDNDDDDDSNDDDDFDHENNSDGNSMSSPYSYSLHRTQSNGADTPRARLQILYAKRCKVSPRTNHFHVVKQNVNGSTQGGVWWTASFTCPVTGQVYTPVKSSSLASSPSSAMIDDTGETMCIRSDDQENGDDVIWFRKKSDALHAAASAALEAIDWDGMAGTMTTTMEGGTTTEVAQTALSPTEKLTSVSLEESLQPLASWYKTHHDVNDLSDPENYFVATASDCDDEHGLRAKRWTASFICPITGERFDSGRLTDQSVTTDKDNVHWYNQREIAIQAAAFRAYDAVRYRETGQLDPRYCHEHPDQVVSSLPPVQNTVLNDNQGEASNEITDTANDQLVYHPPDEGIRDSEGESEEDEYVIEFIPQGHGLAQNLGTDTRTTLDVVAQAWIESTRLPKLKNGDERNVVRGPFDATSARQDAIKRALEWIAQQDLQGKHQRSDRSQFDVRSQMVSLNIANLILSSLAESNQSVAFETEPTGVETAATKILDRMWSSSSFKPNAFTYALFLKCLEGESCARVAEKAQAIVDAMEKGTYLDGRILPRPTSDVYTSLAELKAQAGIRSLKEMSDTLDPNRELYLAELSSMAYDSSTFDAEYAMKCIREVRALAKTKSDPSLQPNIDVFNAPLRWSGGPLQSRAFSRAVPWDTYADVFRFGFKDWNEDDIEVREARAMEKWIVMMTIDNADFDAVSPNTETYESIIQAWVRSGSLEGLQRAEVYASRLFNGVYSGATPRLQTIYPILAAWTHSGAVDGPKNIQLWKERLRKISLDSCLSFDRLLILSEVTIQKQIIRESKAGQQRGGNDKRLLEGGSTCEEVLQNMLQEYKASTDFILFPDVFLLTIQASKNAASSISSETTFEQLENSIRGIERTVMLFEDFLLWNSMPSNRTQLEQLLNYAPAVYIAQLAAVRYLNRKASKADPERKFLFDSQTYLGSIEKTVRRSEEFRRFVQDNHITHNGDAMLDASGEDKTFVFPSEPLLESPSSDGWINYFKIALDAVDENFDELATNESQFVRLCLLIARTAELNDHWSAEERHHVRNAVTGFLGKFKNSKVTGSITMIEAVTQALENGPRATKSFRAHDNTVYKTKHSFHGSHGKPVEQLGNFRDINARRKSVRGNDHRSQQLRKAPNGAPRRRSRAQQ